MSDISKREEFRKLSVITEVCEAQFKGLGIDGYKKAILAENSELPVDTTGEIFYYSFNTESDNQLGGFDGVNASALADTNTEGFDQVSGGFINFKDGVVFNGHDGTKRTAFYYNGQTSSLIPLGGAPIDGWSRVILNGVLYYKDEDSNSPLRSFDGETVSDLINAFEPDVLRPLLQTCFFQQVR